MRDMATELQPGEAREARTRWLTLLVVTLAGIAVGLAGDLVVAEGPITRADLVGALVLFPLAVPLGGGFFPFAKSLNLFFAWGGLLFWPVYVLLAWRWLARGTPWLRLVVFLWCCQGFFGLVYRLHVIMSV